MRFLAILVLAFIAFGVMPAQASEFADDIRLVKLADTARPNSAVLAPDPDLTFQAPAGSIWVVDLDLLVSGTSINYANVAYTLSAPAGSVAYIKPATDSRQFVYALDTPMVAIGTGAPALAGLNAVHAVVLVGAAGPVAVNWQPHRSSATGAVSLVAGSNLRATRIQ